MLLNICRENILVSFALSSSIVYTLTVNYNLDKGNMTRTPWIEKVDYTYPTYEHLLSRTILTNPCTSCKILAKPYDDDGDVYVGVVTVMGETQTFRIQQVFLRLIIIHWAYNV